MDDCVEIANLVYRYAELIDQGDLAGVAALFEHGEITSDPAQPGSAVRGAEAIERLYASWTRLYGDPRSPTGRSPRTKHVTTNLQIYLDAGGRTARTRSYFTVFMQTEKLPLQPIIAGRYHDELEKLDGRWVFRRRQILSDLIGDLSQHLLQAMAGG